MSNADDQISPIADDKTFFADGEISPVADDQISPTAGDKNLVADEKTSSAADEKTSSAADEKTSSAADEKTSSAADEKTSSAADDETLIADKETSPVADDQNAPPDEDHTSPAADNQAPPITDTQPPPAGKSKTASFPTDEQLGAGAAIYDDKLPPSQGGQKASVAGTDQDDVNSSHSGREVPCYDHPKPEESGHWRMRIKFCCPTCKGRTPTSEQIFERCAGWKPGDPLSAKGHMVCDQKDKHWKYAPQIGKKFAKFELQEITCNLGVQRKCPKCKHEKQEVAAPQQKVAVPKQKVATPTRYLGIDSKGRAARFKKK